MPVCPSNQEYLQRFSAAAREARVPLSGSLELTARCNLRCVHCYLGGAERRRRASNELATARWLDILNQVAAAGCLDLLLTGGEPLLRRDFDLIYRHAKGLGMLVTVFTNGTRLSRRLVRLFRELPPRLVEVSLYGATAATTERITGSATAWARARRGVERLRAAGVQLALKTILMRENAAELGALEAYARELEVPFRLDSAINPRLDGVSREPLNHRVIRRPPWSWSWPIRRGAASGRSFRTSTRRCPRTGALPAAPGSRASTWTPTAPCGPASWWPARRRTCSAQSSSKFGVISSLGCMIRWPGTCFRAAAARHALCAEAARRFSSWETGAETTPADYVPVGPAARRATASIPDRIGD